LIGARLVLDVLPMSDWELRYATNDTPWEKGGPHPALVEFLRHTPVPGRVLVPGCGFGHDVRALASTADEVVGLDLASAAIRGARAHPAVGGERYVRGDLFALPAALRGAFDWVFEHTCFCAIDLARRPDYVRAVASALMPGGRLLAIFYLHPDMDPGESGPPFGVEPADLDTLFASHFELEREWPVTSTYPGREGRELFRLLALRS
jgi:SAM-dependent methyltransferase